MLSSSITSDGTQEINKIYHIIDIDTLISVIPTLDTDTIIKNRIKVSLTTTEPRNTEFNTSPLQVSETQWSCKKL